MVNKKTMAETHKILAESFKNYKDLLHPFRVHNNFIVCLTSGGDTLSVLANLARYGILEIDWTENSTHAMAENNWVVIKNVNISGLRKLANVLPVLDANEERFAQQLKKINYNSESNRDRSKYSCFDKGINEFCKPAYPEIYSYEVPWDCNFNELCKQTFPELNCYKMPRVVTRAQAQQRLQFFQSASDFMEPEALFEFSSGAKK